jgi:hypothetical protein
LDCGDEAVSVSQASAGAVKTGEPTARPSPLGTISYKPGCKGTPAAATALTVDAADSIPRGEMDFARLANALIVSGILASTVESKFVRFQPSVSAGFIATFPTSNAES